VERQPSRDMNACVFAVVARKPERPDAG
jgi:hypothetical protein